MVFSDDQKDQENSSAIPEEDNLTQVASFTPQEDNSASSKANKWSLERKKKHRHKKSCWLCRQGKLIIDYKETELLKNYLRRYNRILIHKVSGNCLKHQHQLAQAIKRARFIALLPFVPE